MADPSDVISLSTYNSEEGGSLPTLPCDLCSRSGCQFEEGPPEAAVKCLECNIFMCREDASKHLLYLTFRSHTLVPHTELNSFSSSAPPHQASATWKREDFAQDATPICAEHGLAFEIFDTSCNRAMCLKCFALKGKHIVDITAAAPGLRASLATLISASETRVERLKAAKSVVQSAIGDTEGASAAMQARIHAAFQKVVKLNSLKGA